MSEATVFHIWTVLVQFQQKQSICPVGRGSSLIWQVEVGTSGLPTASGSSLFSISYFFFLLEFLGTTYLLFYRHLPLSVLGLTFLSSPLFSIYLLTLCDISVFFHVLERVLSGKEGSSGY